MKGIIYYTDSQLDPKIAQTVRDQLSSIGLPIISCSLEPLDFGMNIHFEGERGYLTMFKQILTCLEACLTFQPALGEFIDTVFFCEHDNLMHRSHFDFTPPDNRFWYDLNWWKVHEDGKALHWDAEQVSGLCAKLEPLLEFYRSRVASFELESFDRKFEPLSGEGSADWWAEFPSIDIRHNHNLTYNKRRLEHFRNKSTAINFQESAIDKIPGWDNLADMLS